MVNILQSFRIWSTLKRWKSRCLLSWLQIQAIIVLVSFSFILCNNIEPFLNWILTCNETWVFWHSVMTSSVAGLRISSIAIPKARFAPKKKKKRSWSPFGGLLPNGTTTAFWIPAKPLHLRSMLSKSMRCTENHNACSQHWSTERAQFCCMTMADHTLHNQHFKSWTYSTAKFSLIGRFTWPLANRRPLLQASWQLFAGKTFPQPARDRKFFPRVCRILLKHGLCYRNKPTYFSLAKMCWL